MTEGPYFVDERLNRSDLRVDTSDGSTVAGTTFTLVLHILQVGDQGLQAVAGRNCRHLAL
jgi:hypothetical protein